jgi:hypothetical protein
MADGLPPISMEYDQNGAPYVIVQEARAADLAEAVRLAPALGDPLWVIVYAQVANHLARGDKFITIVDPKAFEAKYRARYEAEDPDAEPRAGVMRLRQFGLPDFAGITPPQMQGDTLVFYAENSFMGIPYRAVMARGADPVYEPVAMVN